MNDTTAVDRRCPSTHIHQVTYMPRIVGVQCKYTAGHNGIHCGYTGYSDGDVTWTDVPAAPAGPGTTGGDRADPLLYTDADRGYDLWAISQDRGSAP